MHENLREFQTCVSAHVLLRPNLLRIFHCRPACLPPVLVGGSTVNSSSQIITVQGHGVRRRAVPGRSLADSESRSASQSHSQGPFSQSGGGPEPHVSFQCFAANLGFREIQVDVRTSDVMAAAGGCAGPAPDVTVRHQPEGTACRECLAQGIYT